MIWIDEARPESFRQQLQITLRSARLALQLVWRASPRLLPAILLAPVLYATLTPLNLALTRVIIDRAAMDLKLGPVHDALAGHLPLMGWMMIAAGLFVVGSLAWPFSTIVQGIAGDRLTAHVTERVIEATNRWQGLARFEDPSFADDLDRVRRHASGVGLTAVMMSAGALGGIFSMASMTFLLVGLHPLVPLLLVLATLPQMARQFQYWHLTGAYLYAQAPEARRLGYLSNLMLRPDMAKDARLYGLGPFFRQRYDDIFDRTTETVDEVRRRFMSASALTGVLAALALASIYVDLVWMIAHHQRTLGDFVLYGGAAVSLQGSLLGLTWNIGQIPMGLGIFLPTLLRVLEAPPDLPPAESPLPAPRPIGQGIVFDRVAFTYPGQNTPVLHDLSVSLRPGESLALVGHNGAGKTTIVKLLLRLYDPTSGRILVDGVDLREYDLADLRREMAVIFQDFVRYELTAAENIGMGDLDVLNDPVALEDAARRAGAEELIERLPEGPATMLGREFGGRDLSGGEWQKLALARAFVRSCQLLVLDEPTAALDVQTEYDVYTRFHEITRDRMTILISHRFSTVRMADRILYLADGAIQEEGSHEELMARGGSYAELYRLQAARYLEGEEMGAIA